MNKNRYYIVAFIKNDQRYLKEWLDHHIKIGFTDIILIEDISSGSHSDITNTYPQVRLYRYEDLFDIYNIPKSFMIPEDPARSNQLGRQFQIYNMAVNLIIKEQITKDHINSWAAFIDDDEYVHLNKFKTLDDFTDFYDESSISGVMIPWEVYGANDHIEWTPDVVDSYDLLNHSKQIPEENYIDDNIWRFKGFMHLNADGENYNKLFSVHYIKGSVYLDGTQVPQLPPFNDYVPADEYKTWQEFIEKYHIRDNRDVVLKHAMTKSLQDWCYRVKVRGSNLIEEGDLAPAARDIDAFFKLNPDMAFAKDFLISRISKPYDEIDFHQLQIDYDNLKKGK